MKWCPDNLPCDVAASLPMRGEWIEICAECWRAYLVWRLSPCGESGLKLLRQNLSAPCCGSLPMRGEWIEIVASPTDFLRVSSLPMRGEWIEICRRCHKHVRLWSLPMRGEWIEIISNGFIFYATYGLSPCGESGLKCGWECWPRSVRPSLPMRGEWIEIFGKYRLYSGGCASLPMRGEWIEIV